MREFYLLFVLTFLLSIVGFGQSNEEKDDVWYGNYYFKKGFDSMRKDIGMSEIYADSTIYFFERADNKHGIAMHSFLLGCIAHTKGNASEAKGLISEFIESAQNAEETKLIGLAYYRLAIVDEGLGNLDEAIESLYDALKFHEMEKDTSSVAIDLNSIGSINRKMKQYDVAEKEFLKALELNTLISSYDGIATNRVNLGNLYAERNEFEKAISNYQEAIYYDSLTNFQYGLAFDFENLGVMYGKQEKYVEAQGALLESLRIRKTLGGKYELGLSYLKLGELAYARLHYTEALSNLDEAQDLVDVTSHLETQRDIYKIKADISRARGNYKEALEFSDLFVETKDSILNRGAADKISELNVQFETEKKEQEIELLSKDKELAATRLSAARRQTYGLLVGLLIITSLLFGVFRLNRKTQSQNAIISSALSEKELLLREIHHRVKNNLQFISSLLRLQSDHVDDPTALDALQQGHDRVRSMALIHQDLYKEENLTGVNTKDYFTKLITGLFKSNNIHDDRIKLDLDVSELNLDVDTIVPIGLITNELVTNSLKYAFPEERQGKVHVSLKESDGKLQLSVSDDGVGMSNDIENALGASFGYKLINALVGQLDGDLAFHDSSGTSVDISIGRYEKV